MAIIVMAARIRFTMMDRRLLVADVRRARAEAKRIWERLAPHLAILAEHKSTEGIKNGTYAI
jgi:hypothetical protein